MMVWMLHTSVQAALLSWHSQSIGKRRKKARNVAPLCLFWTIWKEGNRRAFDNVEPSDQELKFSFLCNFVKRTRGLGQESFSMIDFINWLGCQ